MEVPDLINDARTLYDWAVETHQILETLKMDHQLLLPPYNLNICFAVDYFDIHRFLFGVAPIHREWQYGSLRQGADRWNTESELVGEHAARVTLYYGLPRSYYPLMLLDPYYLEYLLKGSGHSTALDLPEYETLKSNLQNIVPALNHKLGIISRLREDPDRQDEVERAKIELYDALVEKAPSLLYAVTVLRGQSSELFSRLVPERLSTDISKWPLLGDCSKEEDERTVKELAIQDDINPYWLELFNEVRKGTKWENQNKFDAMALTIIENLNKWGSSRNSVVLFVSSPGGMRKVMRKAGDRASVILDQGNGQLIKLQVLRNIELFKHYNRYRLQDNNSQQPNNEEIIKRIDIDLDTLKPFTRGIIDHIIGRLQDPKGEDPGSDSHRMRSHSNAIGVIRKFVRNAKDLRRALGSAHSVMDSSTYLEPYEHLKAWFPDAVGDDTQEAIRFWDNAMDAIVQLLRNSDQYRDYIWKKVSQLKIGLMNELLMLDSSSKLAEELGKRAKEQSISNFQRFPFLADFSHNCKLQDDLDELQKLMGDRKLDLEWDKVHQHLARMTDKVSMCTYWDEGEGQTKIQRLIRDPERMLLIYAFLHAWGSSKSVVDGIDSFFEPRFFEPIQRELPDEYARRLDDLKNDFRLIRSWAELELNKFDDESRKWVMNSLNITPQRIRDDGDSVENIDCRLLHLAAYIAGLRGRDNKWCPGFDWADVVRLRELTLQAVERQRPRDRSLLDRTRVNLAYVIAMGSEKNAADKAQKVMDSVETDDKFLFRGCLHAKGYVKMRLGMMATDMREQYDYYREAEGYFLFANTRRRFASPAVHGKNRLKDDLSFVQGELKKLDEARRNGIFDIGPNDVIT
jgi:hypothetical protein